MTTVRKTSAKVYKRIEKEGLLSKMRFLIYSCLYQSGPLTASEVFHTLKLKTNQSGRFTELREIGVIREIGTTECSMTGNKVILWDVTDKMPRKTSIVEKRKKKAKIKKLIKELAIELKVRPKKISKLLIELL